MAGKYVGFDKPASAAAIAASVGRRKYGAKRFQQHAAAGKPFKPSSR